MGDGGGTVGGGGCVCSGSIYWVSLQPFMFFTVPREILNIIALFCSIDMKLDLK